MNASISSVGCIFVHVVTYLSTHSVHPYKNFKNHYLGGIWPNRKTVTGKHNFHEILLLFFKLSKKIEKLSNEQQTHAIAKCTLIGLVQ